MCSLRAQSRAAGDSGRALDRDKIGGPLMRLWTSHQPSNLSFFHGPVQCGPMAFLAHHIPGSRTCLCPGENEPHSCLPYTKTTDHTVGAVQVCPLPISPSIFLGELRNPKWPGPCPTKNCLLFKGWQPSLGQVLLE